MVYSLPVGGKAGFAVVIDPSGTKPTKTGQRNLINRSGISAG
jgi:hypothetical protein